MRFATTLVATTLALAPLLGFSSEANAQQQRPRRRPAAAAAETVDGAGPTPTMAEFDAIVARLQGRNPDEVRESITLLTILNDPAAIPPLSALLRAGQTDVITDAALEALQRLEMPSSLDVLSEYTHHRRVHARRRAYAAIAAIEDRRVPVLLEQGLRDSDRTIREDAAQALGRIGARGSLEMLFRAFERGVLGASESIGRLGTGADVARFTAFLGRVPISVMLGGYDQFLQRRDIADPVKIEIINRLLDVSGRMVCQSLMNFRDTMPAPGRAAPNELRRALTTALDQVAWDGGATRCRSLDRAATAAGGAR